MASVVTSRPERVFSHLNPLAMVRNLLKHRDLIRQFTKRDIAGRYQGSILGLIWSFVNPLVLLLIYTFVFGVVFQSRWPNAKTNNLGEFAVILFCGLSTFNIFSEAINRSTSIIISSQSYVKKVVFPLEIFPIILFNTALFHGAISFFILLVANLIMGGAIYWTILLLPIVLLPMYFLSLGLMWLLSSLGVFVRDVGYTIGLILQVLIFLTPIFYTIDSIPQSLRWVVELNPLTQIVNNIRSIVLWGDVPNWQSYFVWLIIDIVIMILGYAWFMKTKKAFADVI